MISRRRKRLPAPRTAYRRSQRLFDLSLTLLLLPFAGPLSLVIALGVFIDSPGPVLFRSTRIGRNGVPFDMLKFRTMRHRSAGPLLRVDGDVRLTPIGRFLAGTRLDELPQLWNVLRGQMRLVGPRPELEDFVRDHRLSYERILEVPPGLTGPTQLAFADEGAILASAEDREQLYRSEILPAKVRLDLAYVDSGTVRGDLLVIAKTPALPALKVAYALIERARGELEGYPGTAIAYAWLILAILAAIGLFTLDAANGV